jgi:Protein of unknown function (DUF4238)
MADPAPCAAPASQSPNKPVKHHHDNREYLKNFCLANGTLYQYIMRPGDGGTIQPKWTGGSPNTVGYVEHLYDSPADSGTRCHIEDELGKIEHPAMRRIRPILESKRDGFDYRSERDVVVYIAAMAMRTPAALGLKAALDPLVNAGWVKGDYSNNAGPEGILRDVKAITPHMQDIHWYLYWFDGQDGRILVTSDRPVVVYALAAVDRRTGRMLQPYPLEACLPESWAMSAIFTFPLSAWCAALGFKGPKRELDTVLKDQLKLRSHIDRVGWINAMTAFQANYVYTPDKAARFLLPHPHNCLGSLDEFAPLVNEFCKRHNIRVDMSRMIAPLPSNKLMEH